MTKLSKCIAKYQEAAVRVQEVKVDTRMKAWNNLPQIKMYISSRKILSSTRRTDGKDAVHTEMMLSILGRQNGAQINQYLR